MKKIKKILEPAFFPLSICIALLLFILFYRVFNLPSPYDLTILIREWFDIYGYKFLFIAAILEGLFVIGMYFPGSLAIALAVLFLGDSIKNLFYIGSISFVAFLLANILNYYLGKFGYYKLLLVFGQKKSIDKMNNQLTKYGIFTFFLTGFFPNFVAITSVSAGIGRIKLHKVIISLFISLSFWVTIWTIVGSIIIQNIPIQDNNQSFYLLGVLLLWSIFLIIKEILKNRKKTTDNK